jgi:hypothetical protein
VTGFQEAASQEHKNECSKKPKQKLQRVLQASIREMSQDITSAVLFWLQKSSRQKDSTVGLTCPFSSQG